MEHLDQSVFENQNDNNMNNMNILNLKLKMVKASELQNNKFESSKRITENISNGQFLFFNLK